MEGSPTRFVKREDFTTNKIFEQMTQRISREAGVSESLVKKIGEKTFKTWEEDVHRDINTIFSMKMDERAAEIDKMLDLFSGYMRNVVPSEKKVKKSLNIASDALELIFNA